MTCIKVGSDESHFNDSLIVRDKVTRPCPQTTTFEEKRELKRYRTEVLPLTSLTPYRWAKPALVLSTMSTIYVLCYCQVFPSTTRVKRMTAY